MSPEIDLILLASAGTLGQDVAPVLPEGYAQGHAGTIAALCYMAAVESQRAAQVRMAEISDLTKLFVETAPRVTDAVLAERVAAAAEAAPADLSLGALNACCGELRRVLTDVHAWAEEAGAEGVEEAIWPVLRRMADRRTVELPPSG